MRRLGIGWLVALLLAVGILLAAANKPVYIGSRACGGCHAGPTVGDTYRLWLASKHSQSWAVLARPESKKIVRISGLRQEPQESPICLGCHATAFSAEAWEKDDDFQTEDGVQCEACHGPGSEYSPREVMLSPGLARRAGLLMPTEQDCMNCHIEKGSHVAVLKSPPIDIKKAWRDIAHPMIRDQGPTDISPESLERPSRKITLAAPPADDPPEPRYKNPLNMALSPDGRELYIACEASDSVIVVSTATRRKIAEIPVGKYPADVTFAPGGRRAFVSNRLENTVSVIDVSQRKVVATLAAGDSPHGVLTDRQGRLLYVLNTSSNDISVFDGGSLKLVRTLSAGRSPWSLSMSPDGARILVSNMSSNFAFRAPFDSETTLIDTARGVVDERLKVPGTNLMMGVDWHPSGEFAFATMNRTKTLIPMTRLMQGWTITNGLAIVWRDGRVDEVILDEPGMGFADATDVAFTTDGLHALVTSAGTDRVAVVDVNKLLAVLRGATKYEREHVLPNHLGKSSEFIDKYIPAGASPRGILVARDGKSAYVANALDDSLTVIDLARMEACGRIDLGGPKEISQARFGERLFASANITFRRQFACQSCHPDGHVDGLTYDIESDGIGLSPVDNRTLRGILDTAPFKWEGTNPSLQRQCGPRLSVFFTRLAPFTPEQLAALDLYITTIPRPPNRFRALGAPLTPAQRRGKAIFERTTTNDGREIPMLNRCGTCHFPPYYTDRRVHDVGSRHAYDRQGKFDVPHLNNIYDSAPYLHNGMAATLEEIWTVYNPNDTHGATNDMTKDQLNDLIEYIKTL